MYRHFWRVLNLGNCVSLVALAVALSYSSSNSFFTNRTPLFITSVLVACIFSAHSVKSSFSCFVSLISNLTFLGFSIFGLPAGLISPHLLKYCPYIYYNICPYDICQSLLYKFLKKITGGSTFPLNHLSVVFPNLWGKMKRFLESSS